MRLTKKKALELSITLWEWLAETGKEKYDWMGWVKNGGKYEAHDGCFFCEYEKQHRDNNADGCSTCPLENGKEGCLDTPFGDWCLAGTKSERKRYASLFLNQLKALRVTK